MVRPNQSNATSIRKARRSANENALPVNSAPPRMRRRRSSIVPYTHLRDYFVQLANNKEDSDSDSEKAIVAPPPTPCRRVSYITIISDSPQEISTDMNLDFSEEELQRLASPDKTKIENIGPVQWSWGGWQTTNPFDTILQKATTDTTTEILEDEMKPWAAQLEQFGSKYVSLTEEPKSEPRKSATPERRSSLSSLQKHLISLSSLLDANASTLSIALSRLQETLSAHGTSPHEDIVLPAGDLFDYRTEGNAPAQASQAQSRRAGKQPLAEDALERVRSTADEMIALVALVKDDISRLPKLD